MSQHLPTTTVSNRRSRRLSGRARAGILGGAGLAAAVAATLVISGAAGASTADERPTGAPASMVEEGSGASDDTSGAAPASMVEEGSGASDATGPAQGAAPTDLDTVAPGYGADALVDKDAVTDGAAGPSSMVEEGSGASDDTSGAVPAAHKKHTEPQVAEDTFTNPAPGQPASMVEEGSAASDAVGTTYTDPTTGVTVIDGDMLIASAPLPATRR